MARPYSTDTQDSRALTTNYPVAHSISRVLPAESLLKRPFDFFFASLALILSLPLWLVVSLAIKLEDGGPVFYRQKRWGKNRSAIQIYKFRTMVVDADEKFGKLQAHENDPRVTRTGRLLRATSLDEMPQILNIWRGEMSWVGPRALPMNEIQVKEENGHLPDELIPGFAVRCSVRPGLTGIAQIYAPRDVLRRHKFHYDLIYIKNQSFWLDLRLIALSFWITFRAKWEHRGRKF